MPLALRRAWAYSGAMCEPTLHGLDKRITRLEERMNTHQADYKTALERMERKAAERESRATKTVYGSIAIATGVILTAIGIAAAVILAFVSPLLN